MKKLLTIILIAAAATNTALAQNSDIMGVRADDVQLRHSGQFIALDMTLNLKELNVDNNTAVLITPLLKNGNDSLRLPAVGIYGRRRYFFYVRNGRSTISGETETSFRNFQKPDSISYSCVENYREWMDGAQLMLTRTDFGCCDTPEGWQSGTIATHREEFFPTLVYITPKAEAVKSRSLQGSAFIDFPVDKTVIYPDYRRNTRELGKIQATIDSVRNDADVNITRVWLKGFASPESPYAHNTQLAIGRTDALKRHIQQLYRFDDGTIVTEYEPEDWEGLRTAVENSNIDNRDGIMAIIDADGDPDAKEERIKRAFPKEYRFMLQNFYPALRHTDYRIEYDIRTFSDTREIERILRTAPQKLSLNELHLLAAEKEPGSDEFSEVFETAVRLFPDDHAANVNAASAALRRGDLDAAQRYINRAGQDTPQALYTEAALNIRRGEIEKAVTLLEMAGKMGLEQADATLREINDGRRAPADGRDTRSRAHEKQKNR